MFKREPKTFSPADDSLYLDADGEFKKKIWIGVDGRVTNREESVYWTAQRPTEDKQFYNWESQSFQKDPFASLSEYSYEVQSVNGVVTKKNYTVDTPEYNELLDDFMAEFDTDGVSPETLSRNAQGKVTGYVMATPSLMELLKIRFGVPDGDWWGLCGLNVDKDGETSIKVYDGDISGYDLSGLPEGANLNAPHLQRVAVTYASGVKSDSYEVYFKADYVEMVQFSKRLGFDVPEYEPDYWGVVFNAGGITKVKALLWHRDSARKVEEMWSHGKLIRTGYSHTSRVCKALLNKIPDALHFSKGKITNIGINTYALGDLLGDVKVISAYRSGAPPHELLKTFAVPDHIKMAPWFGVKYGQRIQACWLKIADLNYSAYHLPDIPKNASRLFGVAKTYPMDMYQPAVHNGAYPDLMDCSFVTIDHGAVRVWCEENGLPDPNPLLPSQLGVYGVYSITFRASSGSIERLKYYCYFNQQKYDMEAYICAVLEGRSKGLLYDQPSDNPKTKFDAYRRVAEYISR